MGDRTGEVEDLEDILADTSAESIKISYAAIKYITKNFAIVIGNGGFGEVYLGGLQNGMIAVKKLFQTKDFSDKQFLDEVTCLRKVNHTNIVRFLGYCADTQGEVMEVKGKHKIVEVQQRLLCFEYVPNGSLRHYLKERTHGYEWSVRYQIIKGICEGLHSIHQEHICHLDLKPANVLLGVNMEPKITDFGVSRCIGEQSTMVTQNVFGTLGYVAPEFIDKKQISLKSDIYSLGVIMINLLTGCNGCIMENWHTTIDVDCPQMQRCIEIAQICVNTDPQERPTTGEIIQSLNETETMSHESQTYKEKINEPRNDPTSSLHQVVQRFWALPSENLREHAAREDTLYVKLDVPECLLGGTWKPGKISYQLLLFITGNFSRAQEIGRGRLATVYKGILQQRCIVVKRLMMTMEFSDQMFQNLIKTMMLGHHQNIVRFLGYCYYSEGEAIEYNKELVIAEIQERLLCFEYLSNGSLDRYVSDASSGLEWRERYEIIKGICKGLHYLHRKDIIHMDLKPRHILLDDNMIPKISDLYLSRCFAEDQGQTVTQIEMGTVGYVAPEFIGSGVISFKADIYCLGVIITEILTGEKESCDTEKVLERWKNRLLLHTSSSADTHTLLEQIRVCAEISRACLANDPDERPDTERIVEMLTNDKLEDSLHAELDDLECIIEGSNKPGRLSRQLLRFITGNFSDERVIGQGRFGTTYRGILRNQSVAVKRLSNGIDIDDRKFLNGIETIMLAQHKNIVQFLGYCSFTGGERLEYKGIVAESSEKLLCFEYLSNGSLTQYLSDASSGLGWKERYQIFKGMCEGLHYLHNNGIVHSDLKPANILLDDTMVPKIMDFTLSRWFDQEQTWKIRTEIHGTLGYMAPELFAGVITSKSDIYSLGSITTEILTGRIGYFEIENVLESWSTRLETSSTDKLLEQVRICAEISIVCIDPDPEKRPDMQRVIEMLGDTDC